MDTIAKLLDPAGALIRWPKKQEEREECLKYLASKFSKERKYTEMEVNAILKQWHKFNDHPMLRRDMVNVGILDRAPDGKEYWLK